MTAPDRMPPEYCGIWRRSSVRYGTGTPTEPALTLWWQAPQLFIDVRWRFDDATPQPDGLSLDRVMAGHTTFEPAGYLTWHHDLDTFSGDGADRSAVHFDGDDLVEVGELGPGPDGTPAEFTEVWRTMVTEVPTITDERSGDARLLIGRTAGWSIAVTVPDDRSSATTVILECLGDARWTLEASFPPPTTGG